MSNNLNETNELLNNVLSLTREQLSKYMNLATELEALLVIEKNKNALLEEKIIKLENDLVEENKK